MKTSCKVITISLLLALLFGGCDMVTWHSLEVDGTSKVVRVGHCCRYYFSLEENCTTGYQWYCDCDDPDVTVTINHVAGEAAKGMVGVPGKAKVEIRIHRGYDGPSTLRFYYQRSWEKEPIKKFTLSLYKETGNRAFWE